MVAERQTVFTEATRNDLAILARRVRRHILDSGGRAELFLDDFSIGVNDGQCMLTTGPCPGLSPDNVVPLYQYRLEGLAAGLDTCETRYWLLSRTPGGLVDPTVIEDVDQQVLQRLRDAGDEEAIPSLLTGAHTRFVGTAERPLWSLFVQNTPLRRLLGSIQASAGGDLFEGPRSQNVPHVVYMLPPNPYAPIGVTVPRAVQQLRAQCLDPDVILMTRRGMSIKAVSPQELWHTYTLVTKKVDQEIHARLRKLPWLFQSIGTLLGDEFVEPAVRCLRDCFGGDMHVQFWPSSREGILRKAMGSEDLLRMVAAGYPDHHTARLGGAVPLYIPLAGIDSATKLVEGVRQVWEAYRVQYSETTPLHTKGTVNRPTVVLLGSLGVATVTTHADEARPAYAALIETMVAAEGARAFGGMRAVPHDELVALANTALRYPAPLEIPAHLIKEADEAEEGFPEETGGGEPPAGLARSG
jgi:hypothetical protein